MIGIAKEQIYSIHEMVIKRTGGSLGVINDSLIDSAINNIWQTFDGIELYPTLTEKGTRLGYALVNNHSFMDGNKRIGVLVMLTFFAINQMKVICNDDDITEIGISLASGTMDFADLLDWVKTHSSVCGSVQT